MPPIKSENLFKTTKATKNRRVYTEEEEYKILLKELYIDVNDPRNESVIKIIMEQRNEFFIKLLKEDSKNLLSETKPFRHKLLQLRAKDAQMANLPIPLFENEIVDSTRSSLYLEKLEKLFRDEAYLAHLKARIENDNTTPAHAGFNLAAQLNPVDLETLKRRQLILDGMKTRAQAAYMTGNKGVIQYKSVVQEFELAGKNPF